MPVQLFVMLLFVGAMAGAAKCPYDQYEIVGSIRRVDGHPVADAQILAFFDDALATDGQVTTSADGKYRVSVQFDSFRRSAIFGDRCNKRPDLLEVVVWRSGFRAVRRLFRGKDFEISYKSPSEWRIELEPIGLVDRE